MGGKKVARDLAALREARKQRLAQYAQEENEVGDGQPQVEDQPTQEEVTAEAVEKSTTEATQEAPKTLTAMVTPVEQVQKDAAIDLHLFRYDETNPHWVVTADGEPVAKVCLHDQQDPDSIRSLFVSESYAESLQKAFRQAGLEATLREVSARAFASTVDTSEAMTSLRTQLVAELENEYRQRKAEAGDELLNSLGLVLEAMKNNFIVRNPLKEALYEGLSQLGISEPIGIIEAAFSSAGSEFFDTAIKTAREWSEYAPEAYAQLEDRIRSMGHFIPEDKSITASAKADVDIPVSVPLETSGTGNVSEKQRLRGMLGLTKRSQ